MKKLILLLSIVMLVGVGIVYVYSGERVMEIKQEMWRQDIADIKPLEINNKGLLEDEKVTLKLKGVAVMYACWGTPCFIGDKECEERTRKEDEKRCEREYQESDKNAYTDLPIKDFLQLLADQYEYQQEVTDTEPARLIKVK